MTDFSAYSQASEASEACIPSQLPVASNARSKKPRKRPLEAVLADIPDPKRVKFEPLSIPPAHPAILNLPSGIDANYISSC
jgi:hypothetical protein